MAKKELTRKQKVFRWIGGVLAFLLVAAAGVAGFAYWDFNNRLEDNAVDLAPGRTPDVLEPELTVDQFDGAFTMLLVGNDDANGSTDYGVRETALNDVNILLHVSADHTKATAISVPRDMFVEIPQCSDEETGVVNQAVKSAKINQALQRGGLRCVTDTFRALTGQDITNAAMIQFQGVVAMSNAVGGVPVCLAAGINDPLAGLNLEAGEQTLQGEDALGFLRTRHGVGDGSDLGRISNQQVFLSSLMRKLKSSDTLSDPKKVFNIAQVVADNMTLSTTLSSVPKLASVAGLLKDVPLEDITFLQYPTKLATVNGVEGVAPDTQAAEEMITAVFSDKKVTITGGTGPGSTGSVPQETAPTPEPSVDPSVDPSATPTVTPTPEEAVELDKSVTGTTAAQTNCARGNQG
jgi:LCP family protein required for cell wall assembly